MGSSLNSDFAPTRVAFSAQWVLSGSGLVWGSLVGHPGSVGSCGWVDL